MTEELKYTKWDADFPDKGAQGKFAPKLQFADRMAWYTLYHQSGRVSVSHIAKAAGINQGVAHALLSPHNGKYKNVKAEYKRLGGVVGSAQKYVEDHHIRRLQEVIHGPKPIPKPDQISLGTPQRDFIVAQNEEGKWEAFDIEMNEVIHISDTRQECVDIATKFASSFG